MEDRADGDPVLGVEVGDGAALGGAVIGVRTPPVVVVDVVEHEEPGQ